MARDQKVCHNITIGSFKFPCVPLNEYLTRFSKVYPKPNELKLQFSGGWGGGMSTEHPRITFHIKYPMQKMFSIC